MSAIAIGWSSQQGCHWSKQKRQFVGAFYWFNSQEGFLYIRKTSRDIQKSLFFRHLIKSFNVLKPSVEIRKRFEYLLRRSKIWGISSFSQFCSGFTEFRDFFHIFSWNVKIHICIFYSVVCVVSKAVNCFPSDTMSLFRFDQSRRVSQRMLGLI